MNQIQPRAVRNTPPPDYKPVWRSGPPPSIGWWPASTIGDPELIRFYNGEFWSDWVRSSYDINEVEWRGERKSFSPQSEIRWARRWWE